jgi:hypothetical protein
VAAVLPSRAVAKSTSLLRDESRILPASSPTDSSVPAIRDLSLIPRLLAHTPGSGGDDAATAVLGGSGYLLAGASLNALALLGSVSLATRADTPSGVALSLFGGGAAMTVLSKANARLAGIDRSWSSAAAGSGLGLLTGAALGAFLTLVVDDGPGINKLAAAIGGFVLGSAVAAPLWTLVDPLLLTPPPCRDP